MKLEERVRKLEEKISVSRTEQTDDPLRFWKDFERDATPELLEALIADCKNNPPVAQASTDLAKSMNCPVEAVEPYAQAVCQSQVINLEAMLYKKTHVSEVT